MHSSQQDRHQAKWQVDLVGVERDAFVIQRRVRWQGQEVAVLGPWQERVCVLGMIMWKTGACPMSAITDASIRCSHSRREPVRLADGSLSASWERSEGYSRWTSRWNGWASSWGGNFSVSIEGFR